MLLVACGDSVSEVSSGDLTVSYENSVSLHQAKPLLDWNIREEMIPSGQIAVSHESNEFMIHVAGDRLPDRRTSDTLQILTCGISSEVFEGSQVRFFWIETPQDIIYTSIFELIKDFPTSREWNCTGGVFSPKQAGSFLLESTDFTDDLG